MKRRASRILNFLLLAVAGLVLLQRAPLWIGNFRAEGEPAPRVEVEALGGEKLSLPLPEPHLVVFWATWCGPCRVELARLQRLIEKGEIPASRVVAVSWGEPKAVVEEHVSRQGYRFRAAVDPSGQAARAFAISATPTLTLIGAKGEVLWKTTGLSPSLELRLSHYLGKL